MAPFGLNLGVSYTHFASPQQQHLSHSVQSGRQDYISHSGQNVDKWDFTADQAHTFAHNLSLNYGAQLKLTRHESWQQTDLSTGEQLSEATNSLGYTERISSLYASLSKEFGQKVSAEIGAQVENYHTPQWNEWRVYPTMNLLWKINTQNMLNLSLSSNATYPSYWSMMNNVYYSNSYSEIWGNPDLKPTSSTYLTLTWRFRQKYSLTAVCRYDNDFIAQLPYQPSDRMAVVMQMRNFDSRQIGLVASAQWQIGSWANGSISGFYGYLSEKTTNFNDIPFDRNKWSGRIFGTASIKPFSRHNLTLILQPDYQFRTIQGVYDIHDFFSLNASLRWTDKTGRLSATLSGNNLTNFHNRTTDTWRGQNFSMSMWHNYRSLQFVLTYRLGDYRAKQHKQVDTVRMGY